MTDAAKNLMFPGRPDYEGPTTGMFGLLHHEVLCEPSDNVMERVDYVKREKPMHEVATRLHNMIYLGDCPAAAQRKPLYADYLAQCKTLDDAYEAQIKPLYDEIVAYIRQHIPDCAWNGETLVFPDA